MNKEIKKNEERDEIGEKLRGLKRVEAPANFDFGLKAKIANGKPAVKHSVSRFVRYAVPAALVLVVGAFLVLNSLYFVGERSVADIPPVTETKTAPPQRAVESQPQSMGMEPTVAVDPKLPVNVKPKPAENKPRKASNEPQGGSYVAAQRLQEPIYPSGLNSNGQNEIGVKDALGVFGIDAVFDGKKWTVNAVKEKSIAERNGVKSGDLLGAIDGRAISETDKFKTPFSAKNLTVIRDGKPVNISFH